MPTKRSIEMIEKLDDQNNENAVSFFTKISLHQRLPRSVERLSIPDIPENQTNTNS
ncbi:MAG: hypothetical protein HQM11_21400 [SAR324 cluster bacterium]|nr:hypothetical protein [Desulfamplus sp.]MBF0353595.1 hypothetical protein [SAR324 cluster bacterium]